MSNFDLLKKDASRALDELFRQREIIDDLTVRVQKLEKKEKKQVES